MVPEAAARLKKSAFGLGLAKWDGSLDRYLACVRLCLPYIYIECAFALRQVPGARQGEPKEGSVRVRGNRLTAIAVRRAETSADNKMHV